MAFTQIGLLSDIVGFSLLAPNLFWKKTGIPFHPKVWTYAWWRLVIGVLLVIGGFVLQLLGTFD
jgi:hypothetical protein